MTDEFKNRFSAADRLRDRVRRDLREIYKFLFNGREHEWDRNSTLARNPEPEEIFTTTPEEANTDFASDLCVYFTPDTAPWIDLEVGNAIPEELAPRVLELLQEREKKLLKAFAASNYYDQCLPAFAEAGVSNVAMWVDRFTITESISCEPVPASELWINIGARGVEDRFRKKRVFARDLPVLFPFGEFDSALRKKIDDPSAEASVCWGFWRDYRADPVNPPWMHEAVVDDKTVFEDNLGPGASCPLLVGRFNPQPNSPWGKGPGWKMLPELRTLDEIRYLLINKIDQIVDPAWLYPDDGVLDFSQGVASGRAYPAQPGSAQEVMELASKGNVDYGFFSQEDSEERIRRGFYQDGPRQRGKTPPSATQWLEEVQRIQRRLGKPAQSLWSEFVVPLIQRVEFLEVQIGILPEALAVEDLIVNVRPISPLIRSQNQEQIAVARTNLEMAVATLGEQASLVIDGLGTMRNVLDKSGDDITQLRTPEQIQAIMAAAQGGAPQ